MSNLHKTGIKIEGDTITVIFCHHCREGAGSLVCSSCKLTRYCGRKCQKLDWKEHKKSCQEMNLIGRAIKGKKEANKVIKRLGINEHELFSNLDTEENELHMTLYQYYQRLSNSYRFRRDQFHDIDPGLMGRFINTRIEFIPEGGRNLTNKDLDETKKAIRMCLKFVMLNRN